MSKVKHRHSKERGRKRRTHYKAEAPVPSTCSQCGKAKLNHQVCPYCGYYGNTQVRKIESLEERREKREKKENRS